MEAVRSSAERIDVFYQAGKAVVPQQASDILAFLEPVLHPVKAPRAGHLFHPKVWVLQYIDTDNEFAYRLVCSTRNLTNDRSWDAVISLDGRAGPRHQPDNEPLSRLLGALPGMCTDPLADSRAARVKSLANDIRRVIWDLPEHASIVRFHTLGLSRAVRTPDFSGYRRLVISPYVDLDGLAIVAPKTRDGTTLVGRPEHLDSLDPVPAGTDVRVFSVLAELEDERAAGELSGLHAKLVLLERDRRAHLFLGSANATRAAYGGNVEFLVEVVRGASAYGVEAHLSAETGLGALLEEYTPQPPKEDAEDDQRFQLQNLLLSLAEMRWTMHVQARADVFDLTFSTDASVPVLHARVTVEAITRRGDAVTLTSQASCAGHVHRTASSRHHGVPGSDRRGGRSTGGDRRPRGTDRRPGRSAGRRSRPTGRHARKVHAVPAADARPERSVDGAARARRQGARSWWGSGSTGVFELLARALADNPGSLDDLARIVDRLSRTEAGRAVMPAGFRELWGTVIDARRLVDGMA